MSGGEQRIAAGSIKQVRVEAGDRTVIVHWEETEDVLVRGSGVETLDRGDEILISAERRHGRGHGHGHETPVVELGNHGLRLRWGEAGEISLGPEGLRVEGEHGNAAFSYTGKGSNDSPMTDRETIDVSVPATLSRFSAEASKGTLHLIRPRGDVGIKIKRGDLTVNDALATIAASIGSGSISIDKLRGTLAIETGSGDIQLSEIVGECAIKTGGGNVLLRRGSGHVAITTGAGDVLIQDHNCEQAAIQTGSGDVSFQRGSAIDLSVQSGAGNISCSYRMGIGQHALATGSGDIQLDVPRSLPARIEVVTARGRIESEVPLVAVGQRGPRSASSQRLVGSIGEAPERAQINLRSNQGHIRLRWNSTAGSGTGPPIPMGMEAHPDTTSFANQSPADLEKQKPEREILEALARGEMTVAEAGKLLDALGDSGS